MSISDPSQLLQRVPELEALTDDPKIARAIESGDPFKVFRALMLARLFRRLPAHKALLKSLTAERRLFAKSLKGTPSLLSFNSIGFGFVGQAEKNTDGSYIALHAIVVLFVVPIIPLGAYVVSSTGNRQYRIFARAPLGIPGWLYTRGLALLLVLSVLSGAAGSYVASGNQDLVVLNGFEVPLIVEIGGQQLTVAPNARSTVTLKVGNVSGSARADKGGVLDTFNENIHSSGRLSIWNIAGAAPLVRTTVVYRKSPLANEEKPSQTVYCGSRFIELAGVQYAFVEPPAKMSMSKHQDSVSVEQVEVPLAANKTAGVVGCIDYALGGGHEPEIARAAEALAVLKDWQSNYMQVAVFAARSVSAAEGARVARRGAEAHPKDARLARLAQEMRELAGEHDLLVREQAARAAKNPDSALEQYLNASLLTGRAGIAAMQALAVRFPQDGPILRSLAWRKAAHADYDGALRDFALLHQVSPEDAGLVADVEVRTMMAAHRGSEALALLDANLRASQSGNAERAFEFALIARQLGGDPERYLKAPPDAADRSYDQDRLRARAGLPLLQADSQAEPRIQLALALRSAPPKALPIAAGMNKIQLTGISDAELSLLYGEALRKGHKGLISSLGESLHMNLAQRARLSDFMRGDPVSLDELDYETDVQAAACLIRSRNLRLTSGERLALRQRASALDFLHGPVSTALKQWPQESTT